MAHQPHRTQPLVDGAGCAHPSPALHHLDLHGPADHCCYREQEGAQAEGKGLQEVTPSPTHSGLQVWGEAPFPSALQKQICKLAWDNGALLDGCSPALVTTQGAKDRGSWTRNLSEQQINLRAIQKSFFVLKCQQMLGGMNRFDALPGITQSHILLASVTFL